MMPAERFRLAACGDDVLVHEWVRIIGGEHVRLGSHVLIDDFVFLDGRGGLDVGSWVHISMFTSVHGRGRVRLGDFVNLAAGARLISGVDTFDGSALVGAQIPDRFRKVHRGTISVLDHAIVGANAVILQDVTVGEGAIVGAGSVVTCDVPPWTIVAGAPAQPVRARPKEPILELAAQLASEEG
jgi:galactoside O-acetyltransferase